MSIPLIGDLLSGNTPTFTGGAGGNAGASTTRNDGGIAFNINPVGINIGQMLQGMQSPAGLQSYIPDLTGFSDGLTGTDAAANASGKVTASVAIGANTGAGLSGVLMPLAIAALGFLLYRKFA